MENYQKIANDARRKILELIWKAQTSHIGSNLSCVDLAAVLFEKVDLDRDRVIFSAGWKAATLYYFLWRKGRISLEELESYCQEGSKFIGLAEPIHPDIPAAGGSMGLGFSMAVGMARARKNLGKEGKIYVLMSDGELHCGNVWESILKAGHEKLNNLVLIVDLNGFCAMGKTREILDVNKSSYWSNLMMKFHSFGWAGKYPYIDGHNYKEIEKALSKNYGPYPILAKTIKGKGISFMEGNNDWHYRRIDDESYELAQKELG